MCVIQTDLNLETGKLDAILQITAAMVYRRTVMAHW